MSLSRWKLATPYMQKGWEWMVDRINEVDLQKRPALSLPPCNVVGIVEVVPYVNHLQRKEGYQGKFQSIRIEIIPSRQQTLRKQK
jgi:hypothetical protein